MFKKIIVSVSGAGAYEESERVPGNFYFQLSTATSSTTIIKDQAICNNEGSMEASRDIIADAISMNIIPERYYGIPWEKLFEIYEEVKTVPCRNVGRPKKR